MAVIHLLFFSFEPSWDSVVTNKSGTKEEALSSATFYQEQIAYYVGQCLRRKKDFSLACEQRHDRDCEFTSTTVVGLGA